MRVLGFCSCHYGAEFERESLLSIRDHVDKMHIVYSRKPSHGFSTPLVNPDTEYVMRKIAEEVMGDKLIWETHEQFDSEIAHRQMRYKYAVGYSLLLTVDFDEVHEPRFLTEALREAYHKKERFYGIRGFIHFWKSFDYYLKDDDAPIRIENLTRDNMDQSVVETPVYHMSLCQRWDVIEYKMSVFGHKNEIKAGWWDKFISWQSESPSEVTHLHPTRDDIWLTTEKRTWQLPDLLKNHEFNPIVKMKTLLIPLDYHRHKEDPTLFSDMVAAFGRQSNTRIYDGDLNKAISFKPNVVHFQGSLEPAELKRLKNETGALITMWTGDARYAPTQSLILYKEVVDCFLLPFSGKTLKNYLTILGKPCHFIWEPIQNWRFKAPKSMSDGKTVFVGNEYNELPGGEKRKDILHFLEYGGRVAELEVRGSLNGEGWTIDYNAVPEYYNNAYITICENNYDDLEDYFTPRNIGAIAAGSCALMRYFPGIEKYFENMNHCIYYRNKHELFEWIMFLKNSPHTRNAIASNGYKLALENFSYDKWVEEYLKIIKNYIS